jgi:hypothetical protein
VSRLLVPRLLAAGSFVGSATALRAGSKCVALVAGRTPPLVALALDASLGTARAQAQLRDEVLALARETAETSWREWRRGLDDFDALTRPGAATARPRPYRVKP